MGRFAFANVRGDASECDRLPRELRRREAEGEVTATPLHAHVLTAEELVRVLETALEPRALIGAVIGWLGAVIGGGDWGW